MTFTSKMSDQGRAIKGALVESEFHDEAWNVSNVLRNIISDKDFHNKMKTYFRRFEAFKVGDTDKYRVLCEEVRKEFKMEKDSGKLKDLVIEESWGDLFVSCVQTWQEQKGGSDGKPGKKAGSFMAEMTDLNRKYASMTSDWGRKELISAMKEKVTVIEKKHPFKGMIWYLDNKPSGDTKDWDAMLKDAGWFKDYKSDLVKWAGSPPKDNGKPSDGSAKAAQKQNIDYAVNALILAGEILYEEKSIRESFIDRATLLAQFAGGSNETWNDMFKKKMSMSLRRIDWDGVVKDSLYLEPQIRTAKRTRSLIALIAVGGSVKSSAALIYLKMNRKLCQAIFTVLEEGDKKENADYQNASHAVHHYIRNTEGVKNQHDVTGNAIKVKVSYRKIGDPAKN